jgi:hypothetical protein
MADFRAEFLFCPLFEPDLPAYVSNPRVSLVLAGMDDQVVKPRNGCVPRSKNKASLSTPPDTSHASIRTALVTGQERA